MTALRRTVRILLALALVALLASTLGRLHPLGDSLAVFRLWIAGGVGGLAVVALVCRSRPVGGAGLVAAALAAGPILADFAGNSTLSADLSGNSLLVYSKNTLGGRGDDAAIVADILRMEADLVFLQEVSVTRSDYGGALAETHPHQHLCRFSDGTGIAVLSRWPLSQPYCSPQRSFAAARVAAPFGEVWAISTHLMWPYPYGQSTGLDAAMPFLDSIAGPVIVAGDFNMVPWGHSVRRIARATGTQVVSPLMTTLVVPRRAVADRPCAGERPWRHGTPPALWRCPLWHRGTYSFPLGPRGARPLCP